VDARGLAVDGDDVDARSVHQRLAYRFFQRRCGRIEA
jgi:ABC-type transport system involved in Fe-S cluster assembly fused permease/ATPase subunit